VLSVGLDPSGGKVRREPGENRPREEVVRLGNEGDDFVTHAWPLALERYEVGHVGDPEIEMDNSRSPVGDFAGTVGRVFRGRDGVQKVFREWYEAWEKVESELEELIDAGGEQVVSVITYRARGRKSGVEVEFPHMAGAWTVRNGKVTRVVWLPTREEALEAAGLQE
jgi:ketosteroid isomerase-like protein